MKKPVKTTVACVFLLFSFQAAALHIISSPLQMDPALTQKLEQVSELELLQELQIDSEVDAISNRGVIVQVVGAVHQVFQRFLSKSNRLYFVSPESLGSKKNIISWQPPMAIIHSHAAKQLREKYPDEMQDYLELGLSYSSQNILLIPAGDSANVMGSTTIQEALERIREYEQAQGDAYFLFNPDMKAVAEIIAKHGFFDMGLKIDAKGDQLVAQAALDSYYMIIGDHAYQKAAKQLEATDLEGIQKLFFENDLSMNPKFSLLVHRSQFTASDLFNSIGEIFKVLAKPKQQGRRRGKTGNGAAKQGSKSSLGLDDEMKAFLVSSLLDSAETVFEEQKEDKIDKDQKSKNHQKRMDKKK